jgi:predicted NBD/HSP70 family sugar kinase
MNLTAFFSTSLTSDLTGVPYKIRTRKRSIISEMSVKEEITINEIADHLNISVPTATELMFDLVKEGLVIDTGKKSEGVGRKAAIFSLASDCCYFLGVEIKKYKINIGLMAFDKSMVASSLDIPFPFLDTRESLEAIIKYIKEFLQTQDIPKEKILGLGVSISGRINVKTGQILTIYHFADAPIKGILEESLGLPVYMDNDSRTLAYGEYHFGQAGVERNSLILNLDYGVALGIFVNGKPVYGASGYAGELGHIPIFNNEKICFCGKKGCLETEASGTALITYINQKMREGSNSSLQPIFDEKGYLEIEDIVEAVKKGDNLAIEGITSIGDKLGRGLAVAINLFNPELIILAGTLSAVGELLLLPVKTSIFQHSLSLVNVDTRVALSKINEGAGLPGCCLLVRDKILGLL